MTRFAITFLVFLYAGPGLAELQLPGLFSDHAVLQQNKPIVVWGYASPSTTVKASFAGHTAEAVSDKQGQFRIELPALSSRDQPGPHQLSIESGQDKKVFQDVLLGEVWLCSGQSNMQMPIRHSDGAADVINRKPEYPIRLYKAPLRALADPVWALPGGAWQVAEPKTIDLFSAAGYHFGLKLSGELGVPIGLIQSAWNNTPIEAWTPLPQMASDAQTEPLARYLEQIHAREAQIKLWMASRQAEWEEQKKAAELAGQAFNQRRPLGVPGFSVSNRPGYLYNGMITTIRPFPIAGVIWYQGESNVRRGHQYRTLLPMLIAAWREAFEDPELPFGIIQLANHNKRRQEPGNSGWAEVRQAQLETARKDPYAGLAVTIDIGDAKNIHPKNKTDVGKRIGLWALRHVYGREGTWSGPLFEKMHVNGSAIEIEWQYADEGLVISGPALTAFEIAGENRVFLNARAEIDHTGERVIVQHPDIPHPVAVRYGWSDNPDINLFNAKELPASPFRTDDWPTPSVGRLGHPPLPDMNP